jgi:ABC-type transport system involved in multi-copper enzyme maturation permease subunit
MSRREPADPVRGAAAGGQAVPPAPGMALFGGAAAGGQAVPPAPGMALFGGAAAGGQAVPSAICDILSPPRTLVPARPPAPGMALFGGAAAIMKKELIADQRGLPFPIAVALFVALLALLDLLIIGTTVAESDLPWETGNMVFNVIGILLGLGLSLGLAVVGAMAVTGERERRTYDLLLATRLTEGQIVFGKFLALLAAALFVMLTALPCFAVVLILGGVRPDQFAGGFLNLLVALGFWTALGINLSTSSRRTLPALASILGLFIFAHTVPLGFVIDWNSSGATAAATPGAQASHLFPVLSFVFGAPDRWMALPGFSVPLMALGIALALAATTALLLGARTNLRPIEKARGFAERVLLLVILLLGFLTCFSGDGPPISSTHFNFATGAWLATLVLLMGGLPRSPAREESLPGILGFLRAILSPGGLLRPRCGTIPFLFALSGIIFFIIGMIEGLRSAETAHFSMLGLAFLLVALTVAAWSTLVVAAARRFAAPQLGAILVFFAMAFLAVTSIIPDLPHSIQGMNESHLDVLPMEACRMIAPTYPAMALRGGDLSIDEVGVTVALSLGWDLLLVLVALILGRRVKGA